MGIVDDVASGAEEGLADALGSGSERDYLDIWREIEDKRNEIRVWELGIRVLDGEGRECVPWEGQEMRKAAKTVVSFPWGFPFLGRDL